MKRLARSWAWDCALTIEGLENPDPVSVSPVSVWAVLVEGLATVWTVLVEGLAAMAAESLATVAAVEVEGLPKLAAWDPRGLPTWNVGCMRESSDRSLPCTACKPRQ